MSYRNMPVHWDVQKLKDSVYIKGRIGWKGLKRSEFMEFGAYYIVNGPNIIDNKVDWAKCLYISEERYQESKEIQLRENDILLTKDGTIGKMAYISILEKPSTVASGIFVIRNQKPETFNTKYIYYFLKSPIFERLVKARIEGSVIPHLYQRDLVELEIPIPPLQEQRYIVSVLSTLDDKIEKL